MQIVIVVKKGVKGVVRVVVKKVVVRVVVVVVVVVRKLKLTQIKLRQQKIKILINQKLVKNKQEKIIYIQLIRVIFSKHYI